MDACALLALARAVRLQSFYLVPAAPRPSSISSAVRSMLGLAPQADYRSILGCFFNEDED